VDRFRRAPILVVLLALLVLAGVTTLAHSSNVAPKSSSIASAQNANSTALYCTGLSGTSGAEVGHLTFFNTTMFPRSLNVDVVSDKGRALARASLSGTRAVLIQPLVRQRISASTIRRRPLRCSMSRPIRLAVSPPPHHSRECRSVLMIRWKSILVHKS